MFSYWRANHGFLWVNNVYGDSSRDGDIAPRGIEDIDSIVDFNKYTLKQVEYNLRRLGGWVPDPDSRATRVAMIPNPMFVFRAESKMHLLTACNLMHYYGTLGPDATPVSIRWYPIIKNLLEHWGALVNRKKCADHKVLKISKTLSVIKWREAFMDLLHCTIVVWNITMA